MKNIFSRFLVSSFLIYSIFAVSLPVVGYAQTSAPTAAQTAPDQAAALAAIEKETDERRNKLGIPGMSLVIVKDGKVIFSKGLGTRTSKRKSP